MAKRVIQNPFGHSFANPNSQSTTNQTEDTVTNAPPSVSSGKYGVPPAAGKYGAPPPVASPNTASPQNSPYSSTNYGTPPGQNQSNTTQSNFIPTATYTPTNTPPPASSKYGAPPPVASSPNTASPQNSPYSSTNYATQPQYQQPNNDQYYNSQTNIPPQSTAGKYGAPPPVGSPNTGGGNYAVNQQYQMNNNNNMGQNQMQYQNPPPTQQEPQRPLSAAEKALKFPSPVELIAGKYNHTSKFYTTVNSLPPPAASKYITEDQGNCGPRYMRSSLYVAPGSKDLAKKSALPFGLILQPLADPIIGETGVPIVNAGPTGPLRCTRCRAYMCSKNVFTNGGKNYTCFLCSHNNDVPDDYFSPIGVNGYRMDYLQRPELSKGSIEYKATSEYIVKSPQPITYLFVVEVSSSAIEMGVVNSFAASLKAIINALPEENVARFGLITFDSSIQFYNFNVSNSKPQILVESDLENLFLPVTADQNLLINPIENREIMTSLLDNLPKITQYSMNSNNAFGSALEAAYMVLENCGGKMICFLSSLPTISPGNLTSRLKSEFLGTDKEREFYKPQTSFYQLQAEKLCKKGIGVDLFVFANTYLDLATLSPLCSTTGGQIYYYPRFVPSRDRIKFHHEFHRVLTRTTGYEGIMRVRVSTGFEITAHSGNHMLTFGTDMEVANIDCDKTFTFKIQNTDKIPDETPCGIQCALLYTTSLGERRIRIHSLQIPSSPQMTNVFGGADLEAIVYLITNRVIRESLTKPLIDARRSALDLVVQIVYAFRHFCSTKSFNPQILVIPEGLKLLPLYIICLLKSVLMKTGRVR